MMNSKSPFSEGTNVSQGIDKNNPQHCLEAYLEFKNIESLLPDKCFSVFTDGSVKNNEAGSGTVVYFDRKIIHETISPVGDLSISYTELFAVYNCLKYLKNDIDVKNHFHVKGKLTSVHIFTDSLYAQRVLCDNVITKNHFYLIEEIHNLANSLLNFKFIIHWIPSHIEHTTFGFLPIRGNMRADQLANEARTQTIESDTAKNIHNIRDKLLNCSASLITKINNLLISKLTPPSPFDGPSSDDCRSSVAIRDFSDHRIIP